jgi:hypothetical protein
MEDLQRFVAQLQSPKVSTRFEACEGLRAASSTPPEAVAALQKATDDPHPSVADAARRAIAAHPERPGSGEGNHAARRSPQSADWPPTFTIIGVILVPVFIFNALVFLSLASDALEAIRVHGDASQVAFSVLWIAPVLAPLVFWGLLLRGWHGRWRNAVLVCLALLALLATAVVVYFFYLLFTEQIPIL